MKKLMALLTFVMIGANSTHAAGTYPHQDDPIIRFLLTQQLEHLQARQEKLNQLFIAASETSSGKYFIMLQREKAVYHGRSKPEDLERAQANYNQAKNSMQPIQRSMKDTVEQIQLTRQILEELGVLTAETINNAGYYLFKTPAGHLGLISQEDYARINPQLIKANLLVTAHVNSGNGAQTLPSHALWATFASLHKELYQ